MRSQEEIRRDLDLLDEQIAERLLLRAGLVTEMRQHVAGWVVVRNSSRKGTILEVPRKGDHSFSGVRFVHSGDPKNVAMVTSAGHYQEMTPGRIFIDHSIGATAMLCLSDDEARQQLKKLEDADAKRQADIEAYHAAQQRKHDAEAATTAAR